MLAQNDKLKNFLDSIEREAKKNSEKISAEIEEYSKIEREKAESDAEKAASEYLAQKLVENSREIREIKGSVGRERVKIQASLIEKRAEITNNVFAKAEEEIHRFTESAEYAEFLKKSLLAAEEAMGSEAAKVLVKAGDAEVMQKAAQAAGKNPEISETAEIKFGGLIAENTDGTLSADDTLDSRLDEQREWFLTHCGMSVNI